MNLSRKCSKMECRQPAVATLTYVYADRAAVLGPLATYAEPHTYDMCSKHATGLTAPRGWDVVRLTTDYPDPEPSTDDLLALADAVREAARPRRVEQAAAGPRAMEPASAAVDEVGRRGHLRVLRGSAEG
ncbi:MAG: DUF3499 domain-containing protein [Ornithinibacter sp.]